MEAIYNNTEDADGKTTSSENRHRETRRFHAGGVSSQREKLTEQHYLTEDEVRLWCCEQELDVHQVILES